MGGSWLAAGRAPSLPTLCLTPWGEALTSAMAAPGIAKACEQNLRKTLRFGGRQELPSSMELRAMLVSWLAGRGRGGSGGAPQCTLGPRAPGEGQSPAPSPSHLPPPGRPQFQEAALSSSRRPRAPPQDQNVYGESQEFVPHGGGGPRMEAPPDCKAVAVSTGSAPTLTADVGGTGEHLSSTGHRLLCCHCYSLNHGALALC